MPLVDLDRFDFLYSQRVKGMKTAATRDLMATLSRPGIISLAGGFPDTRALGEEAFREISGSIARDNAQALQYGPTSGLEPIKDVIVDVMAAEGTPAGPTAPARSNVSVPSWGALVNGNEAHVLVSFSSGSRCQVRS